MVDILEKETLIRLLEPEDRFAFAIDLLQAAVASWKQEHVGPDNLAFTISWESSTEGVVVVRRQIARVA